MKVAPILRAARSAGIDIMLTHTGQHYDPQMSDSFFTDLEIDPPSRHLAVGSGSHAQQTARVMSAFEPVLVEAAPDWLIVVGDVNSTLACALTAAKLEESLGCRIAHVEAGLRSGDWRMPEEVNRVLTDRLSHLLLIPSEDARANLLAEGLSEDRIAFVGNVMIDTLFDQLPKARETDTLARSGLLSDSYALVTMHRPSNVDSAATLGTILEGLGEIARQMPVVFPMHPRTLKRAKEFGLEAQLSRLIAVGPVGYREMLAFTDGAAVVLTDSGGLQEETTALGVPCVTIREHTERPVTVTHGTNRLVPYPITASGIVETFLTALAMGRSPVGFRCPEGWDGHAAGRIIREICSR